MQGAGLAAISATIGVVVLVVGIDIVTATLAAANTSGFTGIIKTVTDNIPVFMAIGGLVVAVSWAIM